MTPQSAWNRLNLPHALRHVQVFELRRISSDVETSAQDRISQKAGNNSYSPKPPDWLWSPFSVLFLGNGEPPPPKSYDKYQYRYISTPPYALKASTGTIVYIILRQLQAKQILKKCKGETNVPVHSVKEKGEGQYDFIYC